MYALIGNEDGVETGRVKPIGYEYAGRVDRCVKTF